MFRKFLKKRNISKSKRQARLVFELMDSNMDGDIELKEFAFLCEELDIVP